MKHLLQRHPFPVRAHFDLSLVITLAAPADSLLPLLPKPFELDLWKESTAFLALAFVRTRQLHPAFLPKSTGRSFLLAGYRLFVRHRGPDGRRRRGLFILRSETDRPFMVTSGNLFTGYQYLNTALRWQTHSQISTITNNQKLSVTLDHSPENHPLPSGSPFSTWRQARRFAGPMPFTFSADSQRRTVCTVEGVRTEWKPRPVSIQNLEIPWLKTLTPAPLTPASAFAVQQTDYLWKKGKVTPFTE